MKSEQEAILAVDIGGSKHVVAFVDRKGNIIDKQLCTQSYKCADTMTSDIFKSIDKLTRRNTSVFLIAIGITIPGLANSQTGYWLEASFSGIKNFNIAQRFNEKYNLPVYIDNDAQACALAESMFGKGRNISDFIYITVSNGIGGALFLNNELYYGAFGNAGEIGHCVVVEGGRKCKCSSEGCLEMYAAGLGIVKTYLELGGNTGDADLSGERISELAKKNDEIAIETFRLEGYYLGKAIASACNIVNPKRVIIGGGVSLSFDLFYDSMQKTVKKMIYGNANKGISIVASDFKSNGGLMGAATIALYRLRGSVEYFV